MNKPTTPIEKYLSHLDNIFQTEPEFFGGDKKNEQSGVTSIVYSELPESGMITGLTYGLSLVEHPDWKMGRPELLISVESTDKSWAQAAGFIANNFVEIALFLTATLSILVNLFPMNQRWTPF
ncbi:hypothetical protein [Fulvivirga sp.]|uniref:hypothetical protein n=1 Tax=Fulvivirga sp. TaxID=1931237 RepID=UPI0032EC252C